VSAHRIAFAHYVLVMFACLFVVRQYLYPDHKRPKQFRRDPYSAEIWLRHIEGYERIVRKYKTLDGRSEYDPDSAQLKAERERERERQHRKGHGHRHRHHHHHAKHSEQAQNESEPQSQQAQQASQQARAPQSQEEYVLLQQQRQREYLQQQQREREQEQGQHGHRRKRRHKSREKQIYFSSLHSLTRRVCDVVGYPKLLHGLYHRPENDLDCSLFVKYEEFVEGMLSHVRRNDEQRKQNPFSKH